MITHTQITDYLNNIAEQATRLPKVIVSQVVLNPRFHTVTLVDAQYPTNTEARREANLDVVCHHIQIATNAEQELVSAESLLEEWAEEEGDDLIAEVFATAVEKTLGEFVDAKPLSTLEAAPMSWVHEQLIGSNPWEIFAGFERGILGSPACGMILEALLKDTERLEMDIPALNQMAQRIIDITDSQLAHIENKAEMRAADIYRRFNRPLTWIYYHLSMGKEVHDDLLLSQSLPFSELDSPDWVDSYTGEVDPDAKEDRYLFKRASDTGSKEESEMYSEGFDVMDGLDASDDSEEDQRGVEEKVWKLIETDYAPTEEVWEVKAEARPYIDAIRKTVNEYMDLFKATAPKEQKNPWGGMSKVNPVIYAIQETKKAFDLSPEKADFLIFLQEAALERDPADVATVFLSVQNGLMFRGQLIDEAGFELSTPPEAYEIVLSDGGTLGVWLDNYGDVLLGHINDLASRKDEPSHDEIDEFSKETIRQIIATCDTKSTNILKSPSFVEGFLMAACNARTLTSKVNGIFQNAAVEAGWDAWREAKSVDGNVAFHKAVKAGQPRKIAMGAFWSIVNKGQKRTDRIVKLDKTGLTLKSGRHVSWSIAVLKIKNDELEFEADERERIKNALLKSGVGKEFASVL